MNIDQVLDVAKGRTIILDEHHEDRKCLNIALKLIRAAHRVGYRHHGVELPRESRFRHRGFVEMAALVRRVGDGNIRERERSGELRENKFWHIQQALALKWEVSALDPYHYDYLKEKYFLRRDPAIYRNILENGKMIAIVGSAHLMGIYDRLGDEAYYVSSLPITEEIRKEYSYTPAWRKRMRFAQTVPIII